MSLTYIIFNYHNPWLQHQAHQWGLTPPHHTHWELGSLIEYINIFQDSFSLLILVPERDTPILIYYPGVGMWHSDPHHTILVSECDTRSIFYPGVGTWHPIHILSWYRNVAPDPYFILVSERTLWSSYTILVPERGTRSPNLTTFIHQAFFYTKASSLTK